MDFSLYNEIIILDKFKAKNDATSWKTVRNLPLQKLYIYSINYKTYDNLSVKKCEITVVWKTDRPNWNKWLLEYKLYFKCVLTAEDESFNVQFFKVIYQDPSSSL